MTALIAGGGRGKITTLEAALDRIEELEAVFGIDEAERAMVAFGFSKTEAVIACAIARRETITRAVLVSLVFGDDTRLENPMNQLAVYINRIRMKLGAHNIRIDTVWGAGFTMPAASRAIWREKLAPGLNGAAP